VNLISIEEGGVDETVSSLESTMNSGDACLPFQ
jgi:hypothetical protein